MQKRESTFDNLKFILMTMVVTGHVIEPYLDLSSAFKSLFIFIYFFHMPAFIFISGLFSKKSISDTLRTKEKIFYFIILYFLCKVFRFFLDVLFYGKTSFSLFHENGLPWFMFVMAVYYGITHLLRNCNPRFLLIISILLGCMVGYDSNIGDVLCLSRSIVYYPFFLLGYQIDPHKLLDFTSKPLSRIIGFAGLLSLSYIAITKLAFFYSFRPLFTGKNPFNALSSPLLPQYGALYRFIYYFAVAFIIYCFISITPKRTFFLSVYGQRTIQVYFLHFAIIYPLRILQIIEKTSIYFPNYIWKFLPILLGLATTFFLSSKIFSKPFEQINKLCRLR